MKKYIFKNKIFNQNEINYCSYFIILKDRERFSFQELRDTRTGKILLSKDGDTQYLQEMANWIKSELANIPLTLVPFPSTNRDKETNKQLPYLLVKELVHSNGLWEDGTDFISRRNSIPKNTRDVAKQFRSLVCDGIKVKGKSIVVIDDIVTTGSSLKAAIKILNKEGAKSVHGLALARKVYLKELALTSSF